MILKSFSKDIIGHKLILEFLEETIRLGKTAHAYLFYGQSGLGKEKVARKFLTALLCQPMLDKAVPCGECLSCEYLKRGIHPDVYEVKKESDKKNISIEQVRELQLRLSRQAFLGVYKIALIDQAELLSDEAGDSLLKTIEEPTKNTIIILVTSQINLLPKTIISRSQLLRFLPVSEPEIRRYLEGQNLLDKEINFLLQVSLGRPGRVLSLLENPEELKIIKDKINFCFNILDGSMGNRLKLAAEFFSSKNSFLDNVNQLRDLLSIWSLVTRKLVITDLTRGNKSLRMSQILNQYTLKRLIDLLTKIEQAKISLGLNASPKLVLDNLVVRA